MATDTYKYQPTPAEKKLIEVLINPEHLGKSITDICSIADVARTVYYDALKKEGFHQYLNDITIDLLKGKVADIVNASYKQAIKENGYNDRKLLLTMLGVYRDKQEVESTNKNLNIEATDYLSDEDLDAEIKKLLK